MSLEVGRVGVRPDQLDNYGRINPNSQFIQNLLNDLPAWTDLPVWYRGTEQLLPVNDDEPDTSPILCDIEYPVADLKNNQYFTYRQSPTQKDGKAKIRGIRGKTLVWNQLNTSTGASKTDKGITFTNLGNGFFTIVGTATDDVYFDFKTERIDYKAGHKYAILGITAGTYNTYYFRIFGSNYDGCYIANVETDDFWTPRIYIKNTASIDLKVAPAVYDLTLMFGAGNEPSTLEAFTSLFPLPYYAYDSGSLLDFTGTKVKTVGFNQWDEICELGGIGNTGQPFSSTTSIRSKNYIPVIPGKTYYLCIIGEDEKTNAPFFYDVNKNFVVRSGYIKNTTFVVPDGCTYMKLAFPAQYGTTYRNNVCINLSDTSKNGTYESYVSNETELPTDTFFPTGMKSTSVKYDELTPTRAITRIDNVDLGSLTWVAYGNTSSYGGLFYTDGLTSVIAHGSWNDIYTLCSKYESVPNNKSGAIGSDTEMPNMSIRVRNTEGRVYIRDDSHKNDNATTFKTSLSGVMLNYELAVEDVQPTMSFGD